MSLPLSRTSISARALEFSATRSPSLRRSAPRCDAVSFGQGPLVKAACAARTARSTSSAVQRGISAQGLPVYGLSVSKHSPDTESTHCPAITVLYVSIGSVRLQADRLRPNRARGLRRFAIVGARAAENVEQRMIALVARVF